MTAFQKIADSFFHVSQTLSSARFTTGHCDDCERTTRWLVDFARGQFRCLECEAPGEDTATR